MCCCCLESSPALRSMKKGHPPTPDKQAILTVRQDRRMVSTYVMMMSVYLIFEPLAAKNMR